MVKNDQDADFRGVEGAIAVRIKLQERSRQSVSVVGIHTIPLLTFFQFVNRFLERTKNMPKIGRKQKVKRLLAKKG